MGPKTLHNLYLRVRKGEEIERDSFIHSRTQYPRRTKIARFRAKAKNQIIAVYYELIRLKENVSFSVLRTYRSTTYRSKIIDKDWKVFTIQ